MSEFPAAPVPAVEFVERLLPGLLGPPALAAGAAGLRVRLGLALSGRGGGGWTLVLRSKGIEVENGVDDAPLCLGLSVRDWRGALWEGRGGALGAFVARSLGSEGAPSISGPLRFDVGVVERLADLDATLRLVVTEGRGGDWRVDLGLGKGSLAADPATTISLSADDADALAAGDLEPLPAVMTGRIQVEGEMALLLQIQALLRQARG